MHEGAYRKGPSCKERESAMGAFLYLEASRPCGKTYRLGLRCFVYPELASMVAILLRLF